MSGSDAPGFDPMDLRDFDRRELERDRAREQMMMDQMREAQRREDERRDMMRETLQRQDRERQDLERARRADAESVRKLMEVINDPSITVDKDTVDAINDPEVVMTPNGDVARVTRRGLGTGAFAAQFNRGMGFDLPAATPRKRKRKKNPNLSRAFKEANRRLRRKDGRLRKGKTQADIAKLAHRILKGKR